MFLKEWLIRSALIDIQDGSMLFAPINLLILSSIAGYFTNEWVTLIIFLFLMFMFYFYYKYGLLLYQCSITISNGKKFDTFYDFKIAKRGNTKFETK